MRGTLAQLVEQRTENPCVPGSIPGGTTKSPFLCWRGLFCLNRFKNKILNSKSFCRFAFTHLYQAI